MAKINTTVLPTATQEYEATFDTLIRILEQITQQLNFGFKKKRRLNKKDFFPWLIISKE